MFERSSSDTHECIYRNAFRMRIERGKLVEQADAIAFRFAEADYSSAANGDAGLSHGRKCAEAIVVIARRDDLSVEFGRSVEVVVIRSQARVGQPPGLRIVKHTERAANFHAEQGHAAHHLKNIFKIFAILHLPPGRSHAETRRTFTACS